MITDTTTIAELAEILRRNGFALSSAAVGDGVAYVTAGERDGNAHHVCRHTLAAAISAALAKAGAR